MDAEGIYNNVVAEGRLWDNTDSETYTVFYRIDANTIGSIKEMTLTIWPGYSSNGIPRTFHTEFYKWAN